MDQIQEMGWAYVRAWIWTVLNALATFGFILWLLSL